jgi:hypothetical protein
VEWDASKVRNKLQEHMQAHVESIRNTKLAELKASYEVNILDFASSKRHDHFENITYLSFELLHCLLQKNLSDALAGPVQSILETGERDSWACIRILYRRETENAALAFSASLSEFGLDQTVSSKMISDLREHARSVVEMKAREEAGNVLMRMKERYNFLFLLFEVKFEERMQCQFSGPTTISVHIFSPNIIESFVGFSLC